jgi:hypothetical protein
MKMPFIEFSKNPNTCPTSARILDFWRLCLRWSSVSGAPQYSSSISPQDGPAVFEMWMKKIF